MSMPPLVLSPVPYADPWNQPYGERFSMLVRGRYRVAYYYEAPNNSTFRYRAYNMAQVLNSDWSDGVSASYFYQRDSEGFEEIAACADILVVCRSRYNSALSQIVAKFKARGKRVLFDVDDLVFDPKYVRVLVSTLGFDTNNESVWDDWFASVGRISAALQLCDGAISTNKFLADRITDFCGVASQVVPNFLNQEQMRLSDSLFNDRLRRNFSRPGGIRIGYFSGSPSHRLDYAIAEHAIAELMTEDARLELVVVGYIEPTKLLAPLAHRIHVVPFQDYVNLQGVIAAVDINLMPLQSNVFTDCKSELKFFDAAAVGTISIASPSYTYRRAIEHGVTGYLALAHEWKQVMQAAIDRIDDAQTMALNAREIVRQRYTWATQRETILRAVT